MSTLDTTIILGLSMISLGSFVFLINSLLSKDFEELGVREAFVVVFCVSLIIVSSSLVVKLMTVFQIEI